MQDPIVRHSYIQVNGSFVHLLQYGLGESIVKSLAGNLSPGDSSSLASSSSSSFHGSSFSTRSISSNHVHGTTGDSINVSNNSATASRGGSNNFKKSHKNIIIFVPGNPGVLGIYHDFLLSLFRSLLGSNSTNDGKNLPTILAMSHNNFDHPDSVSYKTEERICIEENDLNFVERSIAKNYLDEPHHIELQILNKLIILKRILKIDSENYKFVFIGHSIGCYVILRLLQERSIASAHVGSILIHPAIENLAKTEKGYLCDVMFSYKMDLVLQSVAFVVDTLLPKSVKITLAKWFCSPEFVQGCSEVGIESLIQLANRRALGALIKMAKSELALVRDLNRDLLIKPHVSTLKLIYAINDHWVNTDNRRLLRELYPDLHIEEQPTAHAFVMEPQTVMDYAVKVGRFIQDFIDNID